MMVSPGLQHGGVGGLVGLRAGVRLHVGVLGAEELLGAVARQVLHDVGELAAAVVALAGIAFGVLVGEDAAGGFEHRFGGEVLAGDQLELGVLALRLRAGWPRRPRDPLRPGAAPCVLLSVMLNSSVAVSVLRSCSNSRSCSIGRSWRRGGRGGRRRIPFSGRCRSVPWPRGSSIYLAPSVSTLASLCSRVKRTSSSFCAGAARRHPLYWRRSPCRCRWSTPGCRGRSGPAPHRGQRAGRNRDSRRTPRCWCRNRPLRGPRRPVSARSFSLRDKPGVVRGDSDFHKGIEASILTC